MGTTISENSKSSKLSSCSKTAIEDRLRQKRKSPNTSHAYKCLTKTKSKPKAVSICGDFKVHNY